MQKCIGDNVTRPRHPIQRYPADADQCGIRTFASTWSRLAAHYRTVIRPPTCICPVRRLGRHVEQQPTHPHGETSFLAHLARNAVRLVLALLASAARKHPRQAAIAKRAANQEHTRVTDHSRLVARMSQSRHGWLRNV